MVYVDRTGAVRDGRSIWTPKGLYYYIAAFFNFIVLLFRTLFNPSMTKDGRNTAASDYRLGRGGNGRFDGPPDAPRRGRRLGGFGNTGSGPGCPPMAGG